MPNSTPPDVPTFSPAVTSTIADAAATANVLTPTHTPAANGTPTATRTPTATKTPAATETPNATNPSSITIPVKDSYKVVCQEEVGMHSTIKKRLTLKKWHSKM